MKHYWNSQGLVIAFSISLLICLAFQFISLLLLSKQINSASQDCFNFAYQFKAESDKQNGRITFIEIQNKYLRREVKLLKMKSAKNEHQINEMDEKSKEGIDSLLVNTNALMTINDANIGKHHQQRKRAAQLTTPLTNTFLNKLPTGCNDLTKSGHSSNGIYLVKGMRNNSFKIDVVFCDFKSPPTASGNRLGSLNVQTGSMGVYFYVQRQGKLPDAKDGVIRFNKERLNIGGAMNLLSGVFTAPKAGIYHFSASIVKEAIGLEVFSVYLRLNGQKIGVAVVGPGTISALPAVIQSTLKMNRGDRIDLWKPSGGTIGHMVTEPGTHHFTGWLLDEDL